MDSFLKGAGWVVGIPFGIGLILYATVFDVWTVPSDDPMLSASIQPTLSGGDYVVVLRRRGGGEFGQLLRCADPDHAGRYVVGRLYGRPGDKVIIDADLVTVNGKRDASPRGCEPAVVQMVNPASGWEVELRCAVEESGGHDHPTFRSIGSRDTSRSVDVEAGKLYLVSDNRRLHWDSRDFSQVPPASCQHLVFRLWGKSGFADASRRLSFLW